MSTSYLEETVANLVRGNPSRALVFERWGIGYCCEGKKPLGMVAQTKGISPRALTYELMACDAQAEKDRRNWDSASVTELCNDIQATHHAYVREALPRLEYLTGRVADRHGEREPRLVQLRDAFAELAAVVAADLAKKENEAFPAFRNGAGDAKTFVAQVQAGQLAMQEKLVEIRNLADGYIPDEEACNTHRVMLHALSEFDRELSGEITKEEQFLFPRVG